MMKMSTPQWTGGSYVLITAAHNEEAYIEATISSVVCQTLLPQKWIIVSDGSDDKTDEIVLRYVDKHPFIELLRMADKRSRDFASKVFALNAAAACLEVKKYEFVGHLDADVTFDSGYIESLLGEFEHDKHLGVGGGFIYEKHGGQYLSRVGNTSTSVAGAVQMFRRECYEGIGGFSPMPFGGEDWHAEISARMKGWRVASFPSLPVYHHRPTGTAGKGLLTYWYRQGKMDYCLGCHPLFEVLKMAKRLRARPYIAGAFVRFWAFTAAHLGRQKRMVSPEFVEFLQAEQRARLPRIFGVWPRGAADE
jgi:cellulose synthase/poly-beta-1,6-N-acetylglucosamine synthase-like glycosyltransferase